jgi:hypothetical protein
MSEFGPDSYQFSHRTFMEFFFARYLDEQNETVQELLGVLLPHVKRHQWDVISHLALQIKTFRNQNRTLQALQLLRSVMSESVMEQLELVEVSNFFANALTYLVPSEKDCRAAVIDLTEAALNITLRGDTSPAISILQTLCKCIIERREYVTRAMLDILENYFLEAADGPRFAFCAMVLSSEEYTFPFRHPPVLDLSSRSWDDVRARLKPGLRRRAFADTFAAYLYTEWYGDSFSELFEIQGLAMLTDDRRPWLGRRETLAPSLLMALVLGTCGYFDRDSNDLSRQRWANGCLEVIGRMADASTLATTVEANMRTSVPISLWSRALFKTRLNLYALRGLLLIYRWSDDSIYRALQTPHRKVKGSNLSDDPSRVPQVDTMPQLKEQISKILIKLKPVDAELFEFWMRDIPIAGYGGIVERPSE